MKTLLSVIFLINLNAHAEYRVYQYILKNQIKSSTDQQNAHIITSTLNPVSYVAYNGGSKLVSVDLLRTWMCPGHTGHKKNTCKNPYGRIPSEFLQ